MIITGNIQYYVEEEMKILRQSSIETIIIMKLGNEWTDANRLCKHLRVCERTNYVMREKEVKISI